MVPIHFLTTQRACRKYLIMLRKAVTNRTNQKRNNNLISLGILSRGPLDLIVPLEELAILRLTEVKHKRSIPT